MPELKLSPAPSRAAVPAEPSAGVSWCRRALAWWIPILYLLISDSFYLRTYDSAQVKITFVQMGGVALAALWLALIAMEGWKAFDREDLVCLAPFLAYLGVDLLSFLHAPYKGPSVDDFVRYIFYMVVPLIIIREFDQKATSRITKWLIWTTGITVGYGMIQWFDVRYFPSGPGQGLDPFIWRGAFAQRVFSTFGNPNFYADFLVLIFPLLLSQFLKSRAWSLVPLMGALVWNLFFTETKGAWIGFGLMLAAYTIVYAIFFIEGDLKHILKRAGAIALVILMCFGTLVGYYVLKRRSSVGFRVFTWLSTWEMIETHPVLGTGIGSFKVIYPTFRRPQIFHIEGRHNTETDHAEDEYLEEWFDNGILGFGVFLWLVGSTIFIGLRALRELTSSLAQKGSRPPPRAYDLMGYLLAFIGMLTHNFFDVSMRFVSSGVYLGLLSGMVVNLSRGYPLWWLKAKREAAAAPPPPSRKGAVVEAEPASPVAEFLAWPLRIAVAAGLAVLVFKMTNEFADLQGPWSRIVIGGERLQWSISWVVFGGLVAGWALTLGRAAFLGTTLASALVLSSLWPLYYFWGYFKADVNHNIAIFYSKNQQWEKALEHYRLVNRFNPYFIMPYYFTGNVYNDRFNMNKEYHPQWGDKDGVARTDFDRAAEAYAKVREIAPNYVQMHYQVGVLYLKRGEWEAANGGGDAGRDKWWDRALARFQYYKNLDPVFPLTYYQMARIHLARKDYDKAIAAYKEYIDAPLCYGHKGIERHQYIGRHGEDPEAWTNLANAYLLKGDAANALQAYDKALSLDPQYAPALRNRQLLRQRVPVPAAPR